LEKYPGRKFMKKPIHRIIKDLEPNRYRVQEKIKFLWLSYWRSITIENHRSILDSFSSVEAAKKRIEELRKEYKEREELEKVRKQWLQERKKSVVIE
jgi:hypothetical protein